MKRQLSTQYFVNKKAETQDDFPDAETGHACSLRYVYFQQHATTGLMLVPSGVGSPTGTKGLLEV